MTSIILFILLWASPIADWAKILLTALWIFEGLCTISVSKTNTENKKAKSKSK